MAKSITYNTLENIRINMELAPRVSSTAFRTARITVSSEGVSAGGDRLNFAYTATIGNEVAQKPTNKQVYNALNSASAGPAIAAVLKDAANAAIAEDISL